MRRRLPAVVVALILGACTFPGVTYTADGPPDAFSPPESSVGDDSPASGEDGMASEAGDVAPKDGPTDAPGTETSTCDQDQDGFMAIGGTCGGQDCDDDDPRAYPGEPNYLTALPRATTMYGDWNCNHVVEKLFPTNVDCTKAITNCTSVSGFTGDPGCGTAGPFVQCMTMNVIFCVAGATSMQVQACK
jgi:hypothetical protein